MLKQLLQSGMCVLLLLPSFSATGLSAPALVYNPLSSGDGISGAFRQDTLTLGNVPITANVSRAGIRFDNMHKHYPNNDCDAPPSNFAVQGTMSQPGPALDFDGSDDYVNISYNLNQSSLTLEAWGKPTCNNRMYVISNDNPGNHGACTAPSFSNCPGNLSALTATNSCSNTVSYMVTTTGSPAPTLTYVFTGATRCT